MPTPFSGAAATDATIVPWYSLAAEDALLVEERRVRAAGELRVRRVDAAVDDRDRHARAGRRRAVGADVGEPPLLALQRVGGRHSEPRRRCCKAQREQTDGEEAASHEGASVARVARP